ncbi:MAG: acetate kinase [Firmicutes bacterium]|nr:acetate kinase [Bacillota bacterium]
MKILVINAGSSSIKYQLIDMEKENAIAKGVCDRIGISGSKLTHKAAGREIEIQSPMPTHVEAIKMVLDALVHPDHGVIASMQDIAAVGHRVVHSAEDFTSSQLIDDKVMDIIRANTDLAPLHQPANIMGIEACRKNMPTAPMAAIFDTTFHSAMPDYAYMYGLPYDDYKKYRVRKYGFHGTSHMFIAGEAEKILGRKNYKLVICHLGNGASISAVDSGRSIDTSMGMTPLEGLIMGTRCGDLDPAVHEYLCEKRGMGIKEFTSYLNKKSGVAGISGVSSDFRDLTAAFEAGNERARLAMEMFSYRVLKYVGAYAAALGGCDMIAFTGGVGEHTPFVRRFVMDRLGFMGLKYDAAVNENPGRGKIARLSTDDSGLLAYIIPTNEELVIARETLRLIEGR